MGVFRLGGWVGVLLLNGCVLFLWVGGFIVSE